MARAAVNILLVEDDMVDVQAFRRALTALQLANSLYVAADGVEALEYLRGLGNREPLSRPYVILLDINLPRMNGLEFLRELRRDAQLRDAIVFVLTTSDAHCDKLAAYQCNVAGYIVKSVHHTSCLDAVRLLEHYWRIVELPA